jgi:hypothetical protein
MKNLKSALIVIAVLAQVSSLAQDAPESRSQPIAPPMGKTASGPDRDVLEALLLTVVEDKDFPPPASGDKGVIVLHERNPKSVDSLINASQVSFETGGKDLPKDAWDDLIRRNVIRQNPNSRQITYKGLQFDPKIQVGNAFPGPEPPFVGKTFEDVYPSARGWISAWVPGYSKDGHTAVVRAQVGPCDHLATLTAILKQLNGKWVVIWRKYSVYS